MHVLLESLGILFFYRVATILIFLTMLIAVWIGLQRLRGSNMGHLVMHIVLHVLIFLLTICLFVIILIGLIILQISAGCKAFSHKPVPAFAIFVFGHDITIGVVVHDKALRYFTFHVLALKNFLIPIIDYLEAYRVLPSVLAVSITVVMTVVVTLITISRLRPDTTVLLVLDDVTLFQDVLLVISVNVSLRVIWVYVR